MRIVKLKLKAEKSETPFVKFTEKHFEINKKYNFEKKKCK